MQQEQLKRRDSGEVVVSSIVRNVSGFVTKALELNLTQVTGIVFILYSCNSFFGLPMFDSQPFPFLIALFFLGLRFVDTRGEHRTPVLFVAVGSLFFIGIFLGLFVGFQFNLLFIRGIISYSSIVVFMMAFYEYIKLYGFPLKIVVFMNLVWIFVAILQQIEPGIISAFVAERSSTGRGVTSLSPEPSIFGVQLFFLSWIYLMVTEYSPSNWIKALIALNIFSIFFLAMSALTIVFLFVAFTFYIFYNYKKLISFKFLFLVIITIIAVVVVINTFLSGTRMYHLFVRLASLDFETLLAADRSVNSRLGHQVLPIYMFFLNLGTPVGLQPFVDGIVHLSPEIREFLWGNISDAKIMSWNATLIYEMGLFGILMWVLFFILLTNGTRLRITELILLFILLFSSIPLSFPLVPLIFVIMYMTNKRYMSKRKKINNQTLVPS